MAESIHLIGLGKKHKLDDKHLEDVLLSGLADGHVLTYELATQLWKNKAPSGAAAHNRQFYAPTSDISTSSTNFSAFLGAGSTTSPWYLMVENGKLYYAMVSACIRSNVAGVRGELYLCRSVDPDGLPTMPLRDCVFYLHTSGDQYGVMVFLGGLAPFTGRMNLYAAWRCCASGYTLYNDGSDPSYGREAISICLLT